MSIESILARNEKLRAEGRLPGAIGSGTKAILRRSKDGSIQDKPKKRPVRGRCAFLGDKTGERVLCPTCSGRVELVVFNCTVHGGCTIGKKVEGVACCVGCNEWEAVQGNETLSQ